MGNLCQVVRAIWWCSGAIWRKKIPKFSFIVTFYSGLRFFENCWSVVCNTRGGGRAPLMRISQKSDLQSTSIVNWDSWEMCISATRRWRRSASTSAPKCGIDENFSRASPLLNLLQRATIKRTFERFLVWFEEWTEFWGGKTQFTPQITPKISQKSAL